MNFEVPREYRNFVSSAQEVLEQFKYITESDRLVFRIFDLGFEAKNGTDGFAFDRALLRYVDLYEAVSMFLSNEMCDYLWFRENPILSCFVCSDGKIYERRSVYLEGSLRVGDYVDDEWFLVKILLALSEKLRSVAISIVDCDGQFLLIEGADHLPDWVNPECATNRVWVSGGKVVIVPLNAPGLLPNNGIHLNSALEYLYTKLSEEDNKDFSTLQACIRAKINKLSPAYLKAMQHNSVCFLPVKLIELLSNIKGLIGSILQELGKPNMIRKGKEDEKDGKSSQARATFWDLLLPEGQINTPARCTTVVFTRAQFAKMIFKPFRSPALLQQFQKRAYSALMRSCGNKPEMKKLALKNAEVSCRLIVGVALLLRNYDESHRDTEPVETADGFLNGYFDEQGERDSKQRRIMQSMNVKQRHMMIEAMTIDGSYEEDSEDFLLSKGGQGGDSSRPDQDAFEIEMRGKIVSELQKDAAAGECKDESLKGTDDDSWLMLSEEAFDEEMRLRTKGFQSAAAVDPCEGGPGSAPSTSKGAPGATADDDVRMQEIDKVVSGMKGLLDDGEDDDVSDVEDSDSGREESNTAHGDNGTNVSLPETEEDVDVPLHVDVDKVLAIVNKYSGPLSHRPKPAAEGDESKGNGRDGRQQELDKEQGEQECKETAGETTDGFSFEEYSNAMDQELFGTAMAETFERTEVTHDDQIGTVDVEKNLIKNLMEAEAIAPGSHTPVSTMLAMINAKMPSVEVSSDQDED